MAQATPVVPRTLSSALFVVLLFLFGGAGFGAYYPHYRVAALDNLIPGIYSHASNLALSYITVSTIGIFLVGRSSSIRMLVIVAAVVVALNYAYEWWLTFLNTRDVVDAHYGLVGSLVALGYLGAVLKWGLRTDPKAA